MKLPYLLLAASLAGSVVLTPQLAGQSASSASPAAADEEIVELSVFEVQASPDDSYGSNASTSITGTRKELRRIPVSAQILGRALLDDLGVTEIREMLEFAPGTGASLISGGTSDVQGNQPGDRIGNAVGSLRGLSVGMRRNGFIDNGSSFDGFSKDRIEIIRGPQALLYGPTNASGIVVVNTKRPNLQKNTLRATTRANSEGSLRGEVEVNGSGKLGQSGQQVGLLVSSFLNHEKFWRVNNEIESQGVFVAGTWRISPRLTIRADYERVHREATDPRTYRLQAPATHPVYGSRSGEGLRLLLQQGRASDLFNGNLNYANADAFGTDAWGEIRDSEIASLQAEAQIAPWFSLLIQGGVTDDDRSRYNNASGPNLVPPGLNNNPTGDWAVQINPSVDPIRTREEAARLLANFTLPKLSFVSNELSIGGEAHAYESRQLNERWFEIDANGEFIRNPNQLNNGFSGRTLSPVQWWAPGSQGWGGPAIYRASPADTFEIDGRRYRRDVIRNQFPQFVTDENPFGFSNGSTNLNYTDRKNYAGFAALSSSWFDGRFDTLAGYRYDYLTSSLIARPFEDREFRNGSYMAGINWHLTPHWTVYYAHSTTFQPSTGLSTENKTVPEGSGSGDELGLKFNVLDDRISGSVSFFSSKAKNNSANLPTNFQEIVDYRSDVNGRRNGGLAYVFDRETEGFEIDVTASPIRGLRLQLGFSHIAANEGADVVLPIFYNDQFNTNAAGQVTLGNGSPLLVPVATGTANWDPLAPTPGVAAQILTLDILRNGDAGGNYRAVLDPNSGRITNAGPLFLTTPTVGTGVTGLPVSQHQLGFTPPSGPTFVVRQGGDRTTGYAADSLSLTANYRLPDGPLKGFALGANFRMQLDQLAYYYVDRQTDPANPVRKLYTTPDQNQLLLFASYVYRFKRGYLFRAQINMHNALDSVHTAVYPNVADGSPENVRLTNPPRVWSVTASLQF